MAVLTFPVYATYIGSAIDPANPIDGLAKAVSVAGETRVRAITEVLRKFDGAAVNQVLTVLSASWHTSQPLGPAIDHLRNLGPEATMTALAARLLAKAGTGFNAAALDAITPAVRCLAGLPSSTEMKAAI